METEYIAGINEGTQLKRHATLYESLADLFCGKLAHLLIRRKGLILQYRFLGILYISKIRRLYAPELYILGKHIVSAYQEIEQRHHVAQEIGTELTYGSHLMNKDDPSCSVSLPG